MSLFVCATPIGNLEDITLRSIRILKEADLIAAEDTRKTKILLDHYQIKKPLTSYHKFNLKSKTPYLINLLKSGKNVALVSDAGTPGISDPGEELVASAVKNNIPVIPIPGPCGAVAALSVSGLSARNFCFYGFLARKPGKRKKTLIELSKFPGTAIIYESPYRLLKCLADIKETMGDRRIVVAREITKKFEEFIRGTAAEAAAYFSAKKPKGEVIILIEGSTD